MDISIVSKPDLHFAGLQIRIREGRHRYHTARIAPLWEQFSQHAWDQRQGDERYALIFGDIPGLEYENATYLAGVALNRPATQEEPIANVTLPAGEWACTEHRGAPQTLSMTTGYIFGQWLPASGYEVRDDWEMCVYASDYDMKNPRFQYCIPVRKRG